MNPVPNELLGPLLETLQRSGRALDLEKVQRAFDFAAPDQSSARRPQTTVPQQALFGMNAPFVLEQATALAARPEVAGAAEPERRVAALHRLVLARPPAPAEVRLALKFIAQADQERPGASRLSGWEQYAQVLLLTNEVMFVD